MSQDPKLTLQCILIRKGGTHVEFPDGASYHFAPNAEGDHVCEVSDPDHMAWFLSVKEAYRIYRPKATAPVADVQTPAATTNQTPAAVAPSATQEPPAAAGLGLPAGEKLSIEALRGSDIEKVREVFEAEIGRKPSHVAKAETLIAQIETKRAEIAGA